MDSINGPISHYLFKDPTKPAQLKKINNIYLLLVFQLLSYTIKD